MDTYKNYDTTLENLKETLNTYGVATIPNVLNQEELNNNRTELWTLLNKLTPYKDCPHAPLNVAKRLELSIINLPSGSEILNNFESINN